MIGGTGGEGGEGKVGPGREGLMELASAGCEMSSSSYTAGPHVARAVGCMQNWRLWRVYAGSAGGLAGLRGRLGTSEQILPLFFLLTRVSSTLDAAHAIAVDAMSATPRAATAPTATSARRPRRR